MPGRLSRKRRASVDDDDETTLMPSQGPRERSTDSRISLSDPEDENTNDASASLDDLSKRLVRLALACESQRRPLKRQEIGEKVLGNASRQFKKVFAQAQDELRTVFGMELIELPAREKLTVAQRRAAQQKATNSKSQTASWILISILPTKYHDPSILMPSIIPDRDIESSYTALYSLLIALISMNGGLLTDARLERYLLRLGLEENTPIEGAEKTDKLLKRIERDGYVVKIRESIGASGEEEISWALGPRAKVEIGTAGVKGLLETVYGPLDADAQADLDTKLRRSLGGVFDRNDDHARPEDSQAMQLNGRKKRRAVSNGRDEEGLEDDLGG